MLVPPPLRGSDPDSFAQHTVTVRLSGLARKALDNPVLPAACHEAVHALADEIPDAPIRHLRDLDAPDRSDWHSLVAPHEGDSWVSVPWLFAEFYLFRRVLEATGYFGDGPGRGIDPYGHEKARSLELAVPALRPRAEAHAGIADAAALASLLKASLWGNQADLSLWSAGEGPGHEQIDRDAQLLVDHTADTAAWLARGDRPLDIGILVDNAGEEFAMDLALVDGLLTLAHVRRVTLHLKRYPTYVSDTTPRDVDDTLRRFRADTHPDIRSMAARLDTAIAAGRLALADDAAWAQPHPFRHLPPDAHRRLAQHDVVVLKGDANYRRLLDDSHWPPDTPFDAIVSYFPTRLLALRTCKAEVIAGIDADRARALHRQDPEWKINGRWAVAQSFGIAP